jgi:5-methylcytosine-specific restriction endonuclease McrA
VAKSLHLPPEFIETAYRIRQKYYPDTQGPLANTPTKYNAKKIRGMCEICKLELAEETHHILPQKDADERGFFENTGIHKNHPANLMGLCSKCHDAQHAIETSEKTTVVSDQKKKLVVKKKAAPLQIQV